MIKFDRFNEYVETTSQISWSKWPTTSHHARSKLSENLTYGPTLTENEKGKGVVVYPPNTSN